MHDQRAFLPLTGDASLLQFKLSKIPPACQDEHGDESPFALRMKRVMCLPYWNAKSYLLFGHVKACLSAF